MAQPLDRVAEHRMRPPAVSKAMKTAPATPPRTMRATRIVLLASPRRTAPRATDRPADIKSAGFGGPFRSQRFQEGGGPMTSSSFLVPVITALFAAAMAAPDHAAAKEIKLDDGSTCVVIEPEQSDGSRVSSSVTVGSGSVSSSTTVGGGTSASGGSATSSAGSSVTSGSSGGESFATATVTRPDGTTITRRSDGTCAIIKPKK
ncbi:hypothetical protein GHK45_33510 [Sinorhizobium meliloti]|uniref:Uncharacterized protein n=2 Tax=Rhizobium meliloti TaxID=382 RepID=A0A6A8A2G4_RHIML|nr:hypothetical protein [Sinorhizobium meliloti]MDX0277083.1 hypothetical protein [Sinorhizobium meliloti]MQW08459.1 hypothetical protein [Sinorhizobium meliloti]